VLIPLVGGGDIEGAVFKSAEVGFEGLDLELVDTNGRVVAKERSDFDGFFLFERVAYGTYTIRIAKDSATSAKVLEDLGLTVKVTAEKSVVRAGAVHVRPLPVLASAQTAQATP
jgi:hypothetical protein